MLRLATGVGVGCFVACVAFEAQMRIAARGFSSAALGQWEERRPWDAIKRTGPDGIAHPIAGGRAAWRLQPWLPPVEYRLDGNGFRTGDGSLTRKSRSASSAGTLASPCRVVALGDSHTFGYGIDALEAWPAVVEAMLPSAIVSNASVCGSGIAVSQAWLPDALAAVRPHVAVLAVTPWSLREDVEAPEIHELDARFPRAEAYLRHITRYSAVADRVARELLLRSASWFGWPPPAPVLWELVPLLEPRIRFHERWRGVHARLAEMVQLVRRRGAMPIVMFIPLDLQVSSARNELYRTGRLPYRTHGFVDRDYTRDDRHVHALEKTTARLEVAFVDATPVLRTLGPAAFLADSYHLSVDGHAHLAALMSGPLAEACTEAPSKIEAAALPPLSAWHPPAWHVGS